MDVVIPPDIVPAEIEWRILDNTAISNSPLNGVTTTFTRPGTRWGARLVFRNLKDRDRARLLAIIAGVRGRSGRIYFTSAADPARGVSSFPELFTNADFSNGTTGWNVYSNDGTFSVVDRVWRFVSKGTGSNGAGAPGDTTYPLYQQAALTNNVAYAVRALIAFHGGTGNSGVYSFAGSDTTAYSSPVTGEGGLATRGFVADATGSGGSYGVSQVAQPQGHVTEVPFISLARCALVDNAPNSLKRSDDPSHADWSKTNMSAAGTNIAPDGVSDAQKLTPNGSSGLHSISQTFAVSSSAHNLTITAVVKASGYNYCGLVLYDGTTGAYQSFNLSGGAVGATTSTGAGWADQRQSIKSMGNGYYQCSMTARKTTSATSITAYCHVLNADNFNNYSGDTTSGVILWRAASAPSGVAMLPGATTSAGTTGTSQTGSQLRIKGLPVSTPNIRYAGDMVEIVLPSYSQLVRLTAPLDSDALGCGTLFFENAIRKSPADNAAVIFHQPMMRGILSEGSLWPTRPGLFSDFELDLIEDIAP